MFNVHYSMSLHENCVRHGIADGVVMVMVARKIQFSCPTQINFPFLAMPGIVTFATEMPFVNVEHFFRMYDDVYESISFQFLQKLSIRIG